MRISKSNWLGVLSATALAGALALGAHLFLTARSVSTGDRRLDRAWQAVQRSPSAASAWTELGDAQSSVDQLLAAEQSYRTALRLGQQDPAVKARYGFLLYAQGRDKEALAWLEQAMSAKDDLPMLEWTVAKLRRSTEAQPHGPAHQDESRQIATKDGLNGGRGTPTTPPIASCEVPLSRASPSAPFRIRAALDGYETWLIVDTGASITAVSEEVLRNIGVAIDHDNTIDATTAAGPAEFPTAVLNNIAIGGRSAHTRRVAVCDSCGGRDAAGLLGLDTQAALGVRLQLHRGKVEFADCATE